MVDYPDKKSYNSPMIFGAENGSQYYLVSPGVPDLVTPRPTDTYLRFLAELELKQLQTKFLAGKLQRPEQPTTEYQTYLNHVRLEQKELTSIVSLVSELELLNKQTLSEVRQAEHKLLQGRVKQVEILIHSGKLQDALDRVDTHIEEYLAFLEKTGLDFDFKRDLLFAQELCISVVKLLRPEIDFESQVYSIELVNTLLAYVLDVFELRVKPDDLLEDGPHSNVPLAAYKANQQLEKNMTGVIDGFLRSTQLFEYVQTGQNPRFPESEALFLANVQ